MRSVLSDKTDKCPWCGSPIPHDQFCEIQERIRKEEQEKAAETEAALRLELEEKHQAEVEKARAERRELEIRFNADLAESERRRQHELARLKETAAEAAREAELRAAEALEQKLASANTKATEELESAVAIARTTAAEEARQTERRIREELEEKLRADHAETDQRHDEEVANLNEKLEAFQAERRASSEREQELQAKQTATEREHQEKLARVESLLQETREASETDKRQLEAARLEAEQKRDVEIANLQAELEQSREAHQQTNVEVEQKIQAARLAAEEESKQTLAEIRAALEKDRNDALIKKESDHNRQIEKFQKLVMELEQKLERKNANEIGDGAEIDLYDVLREQFPSDGINRVPKGQNGADIIVDVKHNGETCGRIVIDSKNRRQWRDAYLVKLREDRVAAKAEHAILSTSVFPKDAKQLHIEDDIILVTPAGVVHIVVLLRASIVSLHVRGLSAADRVGKMQRLYQFITSETYRKYLSEANQLAQDILDLEVEEQKAHKSVWMRRGTYLKGLERVLQDVQTHVAGIVEARVEPAAGSATEALRSPAA